LPRGGRAPVISNRGRADAPFATSNERDRERESQQGQYSVPGLPGRYAMAGGMPPRAPVPASMDKPAQKVLSSNMYACGANQNCGNVLTDKPTSRVLRPPGGGGSLQIGSW
jgi:hypothetical protein